MKPAYERPRLERLGTLREMTRQEPAPGSPEWIVACHLTPSRS